MQKDTCKLYVRFVLFNENVLAVFMRTSAQIRYVPERHCIAGQGSNITGTIRGHWLRLCYARVGQHGECYDGMQKRKKATPEQYAPLARELESLGYNLQIMN